MFTENDSQGWIPDELKIIAESKLRANYFIYDENRGAHWWWRFEKATKDFYWNRCLNEAQLKYTAANYARV